jgi:hypothetical protein
MAEYEVERYYRDVRMVHGRRNDQICLNRIAHEILKTGGTSRGWEKDRLGVRNA